MVNFFRRFIDEKYSTCEQNELFATEPDRPEGEELFL